MVQALQAGAGRKVKRLSSLWTRAVAARAFAVKRVLANAGKTTPGVEGERWDTPEKKAAAINGIGRGRGDRAKPRRRVDLPQTNGQRRPVAIPALADRARQAGY
jgi:RNA-directed DNA polymerase